MDATQTKASQPGELKSASLMRWEFIEVSKQVSK